MSAVAAFARAFHQRMGLVVREKVQVGIPDAERHLRQNLIVEEAAEVICAMRGLGRPDYLAQGLLQTIYEHEARWPAAGGLWPAGGPSETVNVARELADLLFMVYGTALHYGIDLDAVAAEVWKAHMKREPNPPGKPIKPEGWRPPDVAGVLGL